MPQHEIYIKGLHPKLLVHKHKTEAKAEAEPYIDVTSYRNIVLIALLFLIATTPRTHGVVTDASTVSIVGLMRCVVPGTLPTLSSPPLRGVSVNVTCNGGKITVGQAVTNTAGFLNVTFEMPKGHLFDSSTCIGTVNLSSITNCSVLPPTGILQLTLVLVSIVEGVVQFVTGLILI